MKPALSPLSQRIYRSFTWHFADMLVGHVAWICHKIALLLFTPVAVWGTVSSTFAYIYLMVALCDLGFSPTLMLFLKHYTTSRYAWLRVIGAQFLIACIAVGATMYCGYLYPSVCDFEYATILIPAIILVLAVKKAIRQWLIVDLHARQAAFIESIWHIGYYALFWISRLLSDIPPTTTESLALFLGVTICACVAYAVMLIKNIMTASCASTENSVHISWQEVMRIRSAAASTQWGKAVTSTNALIVAAAASCGMEIAGILKLLLRIFAMLWETAHTASTHFIETVYAHEEHESSRTHMMQQLLHYLFVGSVILGIIIMGVITWFTMSSINIICPLLMTALLVHSIEQFSIPYEKWLLANRHIAALVISGIICYAPLVICYVTQQHDATITLLISLVLGKFGSGLIVFCAERFYTQQKQHPARIL